MTEPDQPAGGTESVPPVNVAVVGLGYWGPNLVRAFHEQSGAELVAVCDAEPLTRSALARRYPAIPSTASFADLLADPAIEAIAIATPVSTHFELARAALEAGKHVFVEKPLAASVVEAESLIELARARELLLMPGHTFLYSPPVTAIKRLVDSGELGEIYFISMSRVNLGLHQPDVSVVWDLGPHDFSILAYWLEQLPTTVCAMSRACIMPQTPDVAFINATFPSGALVHVQLSWLAPSKLRRTAIVGSRKMVVYDDTSAEPVRVFDSGANVPDPENFGEYRLTYRTGDIVSPKIDPAEPLALEIQDFCSAVRSGAVPRSSTAVGLDVVRVLEAVDRSLHGGGVPVAVADVAPTPTVAEGLVAEVRRKTAGRPVGESSVGESPGAAARASD
jgi:predicted dehydrogenase